MTIATLEQHLADHRRRSAEPFRSIARCSCGWEDTIVNRHVTVVALHDAHVADAWREARTVRTVEELDALDPGTAIASHRGQRIYRKTRDRDGWAPAGNRDTDRAELIDLPAVILWTPEDGVA